MRKRVLAFLALILTVALPLVFVHNALAIPAFSRQCKTECSTCHTIYPELNEYGEAFKKNGYVYNRPKADKSDRKPDQAGKVPDGQTPTGTSEKIEGLMLPGIPWWIPLSLGFNQSLAYNVDAQGADHWSFTTRDLVLEGGGALGDLAGFFGTFNLYTHDSSKVPNSSSDLNELFIMGRRLFGTPVNIKIGKFEPKLSLWKRNDKVIVTPFATSAYKVGNSPFSMGDDQYGLEVNTVAMNRLFLAAGVVEQPGQSAKDAYGHASIKFGGADFLGNEPEVDFEKESIWDYLALTLAAYGYGGSNNDPYDSGARNNYYRIGGDIDIVYKRARLKISCVGGNDSNPEFIFPVTEKSSLVFSSEADYYFGSPMKLVGLFRYEYQDDGTSIVRRYIPALAYIPLQNVKIALEYIHAEQPLAINRQWLLDLSLSF